MSPIPRERLEKILSADLEQKRRVLKYQQWKKVCGDSDADHQRATRLN